MHDDKLLERIDEMAETIENQLVAIPQTTSFFMQLDESTITGNDTLLMAYVRLFSKESELHEDMVFVHNLITDSRGLSIFTTVKSFLKNKIPQTNILACAIDGALSIVGRYRGFMASKKEVPNVFCTHCVIYRQHLAANLNLCLHASLNSVVCVINKIKANAKK